MPVPIEPTERFLNLVQFEPNSGCWLWVGYRDNAGYGSFRLGGRKTRSIAAHRAAWLLFRAEPLPPLLDHYVCDTPPCVNPYHVRAATPKENILRGNGMSARHARQTHCPRGHVYDATEPYCTTAGRMVTRRRCTICRNLLRHKRRQDALRGSH